MWSHEKLFIIFTNINWFFDIYNWLIEKTNIIWLIKASANEMRWTLTVQLCYDRITELTNGKNSLWRKIIISIHGTAHKKLEKNWKHEIWYEKNRNVLHCDWIKISLLETRLDSKSISLWKLLSNRSLNTKTSFWICRSTHFVE